MDVCMSLSHVARTSWNRDLYTFSLPHLTAPILNVSCVGYLQDMPLVGVPSFVEFSQSRNLRYFFVTLRHAPEPDSHRLPTSAFEEASAAEAWGPQDESTAEAIMEDVELTPDSPPRETSGLQRKPSVYLPYNDDVSLNLTPCSFG